VDRYLSGRGNSDPDLITFDAENSDLDLVAIFE
jgi:hypothetical protein